MVIRKLREEPKYLTTDTHRQYTDKTILFAWATRLRSKLRPGRPAQAKCLRPAVLVKQTGAVSPAFQNGTEKSTL